jgi:hypothetical protein
MTNKLGAPTQSDMSGNWLVTMNSLNDHTPQLFIVTCTRLLPSP